MNKKIFNWRKGLILPMVIILMVVVSVLFLISTKFVFTNSTISRVQFELTKTYYLARSGVEAAYGALKADSGQLHYQYKLKAQECVNMNQLPPERYESEEIIFQGRPIEVKMRLIKQGDEQTLGNYFIEIISTAKSVDANKTVSMRVSVIDVELKWID